MNELEKYGKVRRPYVGIELRSLNEIPNYYWSKTLHLPGNVTEGVCILDVKALRQVQMLVCENTM